MAETLASRLGRHVDSIDETAAAFAKRLGVTPATMSRWISGQQMPREPAHVAAICIELAITPGEYGDLVGYQLGRRAAAQALDALAKDA